MKFPPESNYCDDMWFGRKLLRENGKSAFNFMNISAVFSVRRMYGG
jgi:hypothetical protein